MFMYTCILVTVELFNNAIIFPISLAHAFYSFKVKICDSPYGSMCDSVPSIQ